MSLPTILYALRAASERKHSKLRETDCLRLLNSDASGTPRLVLERYANHGIFYDYGTGLGEALRSAASDWHNEFGWHSLSWMDRTTAGEEGRGGNFVIAGAVPEEILVEEGSLRFRLEPRHPRNVGLFLDTRELRSGLLEGSKGKRVLNLFAYTGSLGLAALSGGAEEVVQVDISQRYLDWGLENLRLNKLPEGGCRFVKMDSERYLDWAAKKTLPFDRIILDPPVFSRFDGKVFQFERDYFRLTMKAAGLLSDGGTLHAVTNYAGITAFEFGRHLKEAFQNAGRKIRDLRRVPLPPDFDIPPDSDLRMEGNALIFQIGV